MSSFCQACGNSMTDADRYCGICGRDSQAVGGSLDPAGAFGIPPETSGKAIFSLISGIFFLILPFAVSALVFGYLSLYEIRKGAGRLKGRALAISGIVLGYLGVAFIVVLIGFGIWAQHAAKRMTRDIVTSQDETSVVASVRALNTAEIAYAQMHPQRGYTCSLPELSGAWGISDQLSRGKSNGYIFALQACSPGKRGGPIAKYKLVAYPAATRKSPAFCSDESDGIRIAPGGSADDCLKAGRSLTESELRHPVLLMNTANR
jgi:uncharacterized protein DUF4190